MEVTCLSVAATKALVALEDALSKGKVSSETYVAYTDLIHRLGERKNIDGPMFEYAGSPESWDKAMGN